MKQIIYTNRKVSVCVKFIYLKRHGWLSLIKDWEERYANAKGEKEIEVLEEEGMIFENLQQVRRENRCEQFARLVARQHGLTYDDAVKKYPRGYAKNSAYVGNNLKVGHCVHCARADAILSEGCVK